MVVQHKDNINTIHTFIYKLEKSRTLGVSEQIPAFVPAKIVRCKSEFGEESSDA